MRHRVMGWLATFLAVGGLVLAGLASSLLTDAEARGGGGGGRGGGGRGGSSRGGIGGSSRGGRRGGRGGGATNTVKEWQAIIEQEERLELIAERRRVLMEGDRAAEQEAWLRDARGDDADGASQTSAIR